MSGVGTAFLSLDFVGSTCALGGTVSGQVDLEVAQGAVIVLLLGNAHAFAGELGAKHEGVVCQATSGRDRVTQAALSGQHIDAGALYFAFHHHALVLLAHRDLGVDHAEHIDHIAALERA